MASKVFKIGLLCSSLFVKSSSLVFTLKSNVKAIWRGRRCEGE